MMLSREHCENVSSLLVNKKYIKQNSRIEENKKQRVGETSEMSYSD